MTEEYREAKLVDRYVGTPIGVSKGRPSLLRRIVWEAKEQKDLGWEPTIRSDTNQGYPMPNPNRPADAECQLMAMSANLLEIDLDG